MLQKLALIDLEEADGEEDRATRTAALQKLNVRDLAVSFAVLTDTVSVLEGAPAATAPEITVPSVADAAKALEQLRTRKKAELDDERERRESEIAEAVQRRLAALEGAREKVVELRGAGRTPRAGAS